MIIDFDKNPWDKMVREMTKERFTAKAISRETGLSESQISLRRKRLGKNYSIVDCRNGKTDYAKELIAKIERMLRWSKSLKISSMERRGR